MNHNTENKIRLKSWSHTDYRKIRKLWKKYYKPSTFNSVQNRNEVLTQNKLA